MREILFRGFHECTDGKTVITVDGKEKRGVWVYGFYTYCTDGDKLSHRIYISFAESYGNEILCPIWFEALPSTVGQFTGLTDKNGKKIFEGDIVKFLGMTGEIIFESGTFGIIFEETIDWDKVENEIKPYTGCDNMACVCFNDNFISLWEIYWNFNEEENNFGIIEIISNIFENSDLIGGESNG